ncbi:MAG TPA: GNAT family N-acetyltransferase [Actinomycetota bacterium]
MTSRFGAIALRPATEDDTELLYRIYAATRSDEMRIVPWTEEQKESFLRMQFRAQDHHYRTQLPGTDRRVVVEDGDAVGRLYVDDRPDEIQIVDIALLPDARGRGIGTHLLTAVLDRARAECKRVGIHVERHNPARRFYERLGFAPVEDGDVYVLMHWVPQGRP